MREEKTKRRGWVKNAAIAFLALMLVLTFFSNTIMNRSLPEIAYQYVSQGSITARIRGSGTVEALESYEISAAQTKEVISVHFRVGDEVSAGDTLFTFAEGDSEELKNARDVLDNLNLQYQKALITAFEEDYARETREITRRQETLEEAKIERSELTNVTAYMILMAENEIEAAKKAIKDQEDEIKRRRDSVDKARDDLDEFGGGGGVYTQDEIQVKRDQRDAKKRELDEATAKLAVTMLSQGPAYDHLKEQAETELQDKADDDEGKDTPLEIYMAFLAEQYEKAFGPNNEVYLAFQTVTADKAKVSELTTQLSRLDTELRNMQNQAVWDESEYYADLLKKAQDNLKKAEKALEDLEDNLDLAAREEKLADLKAKRDEYKAVEDKIKSIQREIDDMLFDLERQQRQDGKTLALENLDMDKMRSDISKQQAQVNKLYGETTDAVMVSKVDGVVKSVGVTAGNFTSPGDVLAVIEVVDRGYVLRFPVTREQAQRLNIGDTAEISGYYYWGNPIQARLEAIKNDPKNPGTGRILEFSIRGENVESGTNLNLSIGERSANYDMTVPNSAVRSDSNGDFVLVVKVKNSPLGNRFVASRADVKVLARDDTTSAISGGLSHYDFVITTSTKPVEPGMYVRMPDNF